MAPIGNCIPLLKYLIKYTYKILILSNNQSNCIRRLVENNINFLTVYQKFIINLLNILI